MKKDFVYKLCATKKVSDNFKLCKQMCWTFSNSIKNKCWTLTNSQCRPISNPKCRTNEVSPDELIPNYGASKSVFLTNFM